LYADVHCSKTKFAVHLLTCGSTPAVGHCSTAKNTFTQKIYDIKELKQFQTICMIWVGSVGEVRIQLCWHVLLCQSFTLLFYIMQSLSMSFQIMFQSETVTTMSVERFLTTVQS